MKKNLIVVCFLIFGSLKAYPQQFSYDVAPDFDQSNNIRSYLSKVASDITDNSLSDITNLQDWEAVREKRYQEFLEMLGLQGKPFKGKRPPLNVTKTGVIQKEGYRIEKLYYESLPGLYVPANLYIPDNIKKPAPAILYVCGHAFTQKHHYQAHAKNFARNGFVCLIIETIQRGEVAGKHHGPISGDMAQFNWYSKGYNPGGVEVWNGIRGLDLLSQMQEVDKEKLGVTGLSGGGSQSWYLPAADSRIKAAAAVAGAGSLEGQVCQRTIDDHCDCMMPINTYGIDFSDVGALIAPRSFMIAQPSNDLYYSIEAVQTLYNKIKPIYSYYKKPENVLMVDAPGKHGYGSKEELRPAILSFFMRELMGKNVPVEEIDEIDIKKELSNEELIAYVDGIPADDRTKTIQDSFVELATAPKIESVDQLDSYRNEVVGFLKKKTFGAFPEQPASLDMRLEFKASDEGEIEIQNYSFVSEEGWRLKTSLRAKRSADEKRPLLLVLTNPDAVPGESGSLTSDLSEKMIIANFEARGIGETGWAPSLQQHIRRASAWTGRTVASMRVYDVLRCLEALRKIPGVDPDAISIAAQGEMAAIAPYAALLDGNVKSLILKSPPPTQNVASQLDGRDEAIEMLNCLRVTDLPQVVGLMYPNEVVMIGKLPKQYSWVENLYKSLNRPNEYVKLTKLSEWIDQ